MTNIEYFEVGDKVTITEQNYQTIFNGNRSILCYPCDVYLKDIQKMINKEGTVTHTFKPGYDVTVDFGDKSFHIKHNFVTKINR